MADEPQQSLEDYVRELSDSNVSHPAHFIRSLNDPGPALYVLMRAERAQISNPAPALISFGHVIATENEAIGVNPDDIIELIRERYEDGAEAIVEDFEEAMTEV